MTVEIIITLAIVWVVLWVLIGVVRFLWNFICGVYWGATMNRADAYLKVWTSVWDISNAEIATGVMLLGWLASCFFY